MALKLAPAVLTLTSFIAIFLGIMLHSISINELQFRGPPAHHFDRDIIIDEKPEDLVWFLQATDLHLSNREHYERQTDFNEFAKNYIELIKPDAVLITGDITDGRIPNTTFGTGPQLDEWLAYSNAVSKSGALDKIDGKRTRTAWLDIRGNHDNFNVYRPEDPNILYRKYSIQGKLHKRNYMYTLEKNGKNYTFIGVDEVQTPGLKIPFNFIGIVRDEDLTELREFKELSRKSNSEYTVWFAHYPTSSIASPHEGLRNIIDGPYLCGHFHTIGNWVTKMHSTQQPGFAEVELGDWKYNRRVRLAAIDHQLFSFVDVEFRQFPIALVTNPKPAEYVMPKFEPVDRIMNSTHIRVIAFSNATIVKVEISIDGMPKQNMELSKWPLWVLKWNPAEYSQGLHKIQIFVSDEEGKSLTYNQSFSMDHSKDQFPLGARILLRMYFKSYVMAMFFFIVVICSLPLIILRLIAYRHRETGFKRHYKGTFLYNLHLLSNINRLFWPLVIIPIWMACGPHFFGHLVDEAIGVCFVWGILIDGTFIHTGITYNVGSIFLLFVHIPLLILLTKQVSNIHQSATQESRSASSILSFKLVTYLAVTALQLWMSSLLLSAYGTIAFFTSFPFIWCIFIYAFCWYQCTTLKKSDFVKFNQDSESHEEQQALTGQKVRDDKSNSSDHSTC